jgi:hypothetical protein
VSLEIYPVDLGHGVRDLRPYIELILAHLELGLLLKRLHSEYVRAF